MFEIRSISYSDKVSFNRPEPEEPGHVPDRAAEGVDSTYQ